MIVLAVCLSAHAVLLVLMGIVHAAGGVSFGGPLWAVAAVVPLAGPVTAFALVAGERLPKVGNRAEDPEKARVPSTEDQLLASAESARETVSLEDAMLVSDQSTRRGLMMDVLLYDGDGNGDGGGSTLARARASADPEVAHYASSATMEISSDYDKALTLWNLRFTEDPDDPETVRRYLDVLEHYLESGLAQGTLRRLQEARYREVLHKKIEIDPEELDYANLAGSLLSDGRAEDADAVIARMEGLYPNADDTFLLRMRYWYVLRRADQIQLMVLSRKGRHVSSRMRSVLDFWEKVG